MTRPASSPLIRAQELLGREVHDAEDHYLGRVYDLEAQGEGNELRVVSLAVGAKTWISRFGWSTREHGRLIPWQDVVSLSPHITIRASGNKR